MHDFFEPLKIKMEREVLRASVMHMITCPDCGGILDMDTAVLAEAPGHAGIACGVCFDKQVNKAAKAEGLTFNEWIRMRSREGVKIYDGRVLLKQYKASLCSD
jgi:hypothetical protein